MFSSKINVRDLILKKKKKKKKKLFTCTFKKFRCPKNSNKMILVPITSLDRPKVTKGLIIDLP